MPVLGRQVDTRVFQLPTCAVPHLVFGLRVVAPCRAKWRPVAPIVSPSWCPWWRRRGARRASGAFPSAGPPLALPSGGRPDTSRQHTQRLLGRNPPMVCTANAVVMSHPGSRQPARTRPDKPCRHCCQRCGARQARAEERPQQHRALRVRWSLRSLRRLRHGGKAAHGCAPAARRLRAERSLRQGCAARRCGRAVAAARLRGQCQAVRGTAGRAGARQGSTSAATR